jgi:hypothetical protein
MSNSGLYTSIYREIHDWADLIDRVISGIATGQSQASDDDRQRLAKLLDQLDTAPIASSVQHLKAVLGDQRVKWSEVAAALRTNAPSSAAIERLEEIARALERRRVGVLDRLRTADAE